MAETPTLDTLARLFLDLWQDQVSALAADPQTAEHWHRLVQIALGLPLAPGDDTAGAPGAPSSAAAPGLGGNDPHELARRVAELEGRVGALESGAVAARRPTGAGGPRPKPRAKPRRKPPAG